MGISVWQLLIILLIVVLLFGTKKLRGIGKDMGGAVKGFRDAMGNAEDKDKADEGEEETEREEPGRINRVIEGEVESEAESRPKEKNKA